ncbi:MAG: cytochrome c-type biogenesis protein CcmH [Gammaproteobacteria bacterium]
MIKKCLIILTCVIFNFYSAYASQNTQQLESRDIYQFDSIEQQYLFHDLLKQLRCLVCQNQNLEDSHAGLAQDLRHEVYLQVKQGKNKQQVIHYLTQRYGDFILFKPPINHLTYVLWFAPLILLIGAILLLFLVIKHSNINKNTKKSLS